MQGHLRRNMAVASVAAAGVLSAVGVAGAVTSAPLLALNDYWGYIAAGRYAAAYQFIAPGGIGLSSAQFVASERRDGIKQIQFRGLVARSTASVATIVVVRLKTVDVLYGCRLWSGRYEMVRVRGRWLIARSDIVPHGCPAASAPPSRSSTLDVHDFNRNKLAVTVLIYADPAPPASQFVHAPRGSRLVAIRETLTDDGPSGISDDANIDTALIGSNGQVYTPAGDQIRGCTNFAYGQFTLTRGESETGCVVFEVPYGVRLKRITFTLTDGSIDSAHWTVV